MTAPVLGLNFGTHDAAAAIVADGRVAAAAEEERFTRHKHTKAFPAEAAAYCLREAGIGGSDLQCVALFVDPKRHLALPLMNLYHGFPRSIRSLRSDLDKYRHRNAAVRHIRDSGLFHPGCRVVPVAHHRAHAASAYLTSPFDQALVVTMDGRGEYETACVFEGRDSLLVRRHANVYPHSIGYLYSMATRYLGFRPQKDEYKVMGLAAHGSQSLVAAVNDLGRIDNQTGRLRLNLDYFDHHRRPSGARHLYSQAFVERFGPPRRPGDPITDRHRDVAFAIQNLTERLIGQYIAFAQRVVPSRQLCLAGGVALNSVANAKILASGRFDDVYIQPAANDAGTSIGAALVTASQHPPCRHVFNDVFLGPEYGADAIDAALADLPSQGYRISRGQNPYEAAAGLLHAGRVIGWFQGRMELGPRALGARSILAAAADAAVVDRVNTLIKRRERFRPLAPAVAADAAELFFEVHAAGKRVYPFMLATATVKPAARAMIPAVVHVDGSARVQIVDHSTNPNFSRLIDAYRKRSELPVVLNTSFNGADEPIVRTPRDAVRTFVACGLDALVIGDYVVERNEWGSEADRR